MLHPIRGGFFILQLHDELLYEVAEDDVIQVQPCSSSVSSTVLLYFKQAFLPSFTFSSLDPLFLHAERSVKTKFSWMKKTSLHA